MRSKGRKQRAVTLTTRDRRDPAPVAHRTPRTTRRPAVPDPTGAAAQPRRRRTTRRQTRRRRGPHLPLAQQQARHPTRTPPHQRDAPSRRRRRHRDDRPLARPRKHQDHQHLRARRPRPQGTSDRPHRPDRHQARPLPTQRHAPRLPRQPLIMPSTPILQTRLEQAKRSRHDVDSA